MKEADVKNNIEIVNKLFAECWEMFNEIRRDNWTDAGWSKMVEQSDYLVKKYGNNDFALYLVLAVVNEAEREYKLKPTDRAEAYKEAHTIFKAASITYNDMISSCKTCEDCMSKIKEYTEAHNSRFARQLSKTIYEEIYRLKRIDGSFVKEAFKFYQKYEPGILKDSTKKAYIEAENIIKVHPEFTTHMMQMFDVLKKKGDAVNERARCAC